MRFGSPPTTGYCYSDESATELTWWATKNFKTVVGKFFENLNIKIGKYFFAIYSKPLESSLKTSTLIIKGQCH